MAYAIKFDDEVQDIIKKWKKSNAVNYKKFVLESRHAEMCVVFFN